MLAMSAKEQKSKLRWYEIISLIILTPIVYCIAVHCLSIPVVDFIFNREKISVLTPVLIVVGFDILSMTLIYYYLQNRFRVKIVLVVLIFTLSAAILTLICMGYAMDVH